jgi:transposase
MPRRIHLDLAKVEALAAQGCSEQTIANELGVSLDTIHDRKKVDKDFAAAMRRGRATAAKMTSQKLFELAMQGNVTALIWFEKSRMNYGENYNLQIDGAVRHVHRHQLKQSTDRVAEILGILAEIGVIPSPTGKNGDSKDDAVYPGRADCETSRVSVAD